MSNYKLPTTDNDWDSSIGDREKSDIPGLTLYDVDCPPRKILPDFVTDPTTGKEVEHIISIPMNKIERIFENDFKCPICLDTMDKTSAVTTCLHRFCGECIQRSLRQTISKDKRHECPSCRAEIASRRASKPDTEFDILISLLTAKQTTGSDSLTSTQTTVDNNMSSTSADSPRGADGKRTYKYDPITSKSGVPVKEEKMDLKPYWKAHQDNINEFKRRQQEVQKVNEAKRKQQQLAAVAAAQNAANKRVKPNSPPPVAPPTSSYSGSTGNGKLPPSTVLPLLPPVDPNKILFGLFPLSEWLNDIKCIKEVQALKLTPNPEVYSFNLDLKSPYLRVPNMLKIGDLKQYVKKKYLLNDEQFGMLEIIARFEDKLVILDEFLTIKDITQRFWDQKREFLLHFRLFNKSPW